MPTIVLYAASWPCLVVNSCESVGNDGCKAKTRRGVPTLLNQNKALPPQWKTSSASELSPKHKLLSNFFSAKFLTFLWRSSPLNQKMVRGVSDLRVILITILRSSLIHQLHQWAWLYLKQHTSLKTGTFFRVLSKLSSYSDLFLKLQNWNISWWYCYMKSLNAFKIGWDLVWSHTCVKCPAYALFTKHYTLQSANYTLHTVMHICVDCSLDLCRVFQTVQLISM